MAMELSGLLTLFARVNLFCQALTLTGAFLKLPVRPRCDCLQLPRLVRSGPRPRRHARTCWLRCVGYALYML